MTVPHDRALPVPAEDELIDGHSVTELDDYLATGRRPYDPSIENSASCRLYLAALGRLKDRSWDALTRQAENEPDREELWISGLLDTIKDEVRAGRDIPISHPDPTIRLTVTEAAVHGLIRHAADSLDGVILGRTILVGDITEPAATVVVTVTVAAEYGRPLSELAEQLRVRVRDALEQHTELDVTAVTVVVDDIYTETATPRGMVARDE